MRLVVLLALLALALPTAGLASTVVDFKVINPPRRADPALLTGPLATSFTCCSPFVSRPRETASPTGAIITSTGVDGLTGLENNTLTSETFQFSSSTLGLNSQGGERDVGPITSLSFPGTGELTPAIAGVTTSIAVPEPSALGQLELGLLGMGVIALGAIVRRKLLRT